jgi:hypothetical protein
MAERRPVAPRTFFLNETHEHARDDREGGGRLPAYTNIDWPTKGNRLAKSLRAVRRAVAHTPDPLREARLFLLSLPELKVEKLSSAKTAKSGLAETVTDFAGEHARVFERLGMDLLRVTSQGEALVHAKTETVDQLESTAARLGIAGKREQARWALLSEFQTPPMETRVDPDWLKSLDEKAPHEVIVELQPVLTREEYDLVSRAIRDLLGVSQHDEVVAAGRDVSGRRWIRARLRRATIKRLATTFQSVQSIHPPLRSVAFAGPAGKRSARSTEPGSAPVSPDLPAVAVVDSGIPRQHKLLADYRRGEWRHPDAGQTNVGDHGSRVASRVVFGEVDAGRSGFEPPPGTCKFLDVTVPNFPDGNGESEFDDKAIFEALREVTRNYPDVRVINLSLGSRLPLSRLGEVVRQERYVQLQDLDNLAFEHDVIIVVAAGNTPPGVIPNVDYPGHVDEQDWGLGSPAAGFNTLVVGAYVAEANADGVGRRPGWPSPFTRIGPGVARAPVPNFSAGGGDNTANYQWHVGQGLGVWTLSQYGDWEDAAGTSFSAPVVAREAALVIRELQRRCAPGVQPFAATVKAFLSLVARHAVPGQRFPSAVQALADSTLGHGRPLANRLTTINPDTAVFLWQGTLERAGHVARIRVPVPQDWLREAKAPRLRTVCAWHSPVFAGAPDVWACRQVRLQLRPSLGGKALRGKGVATSAYPLIDRVYDLSTEHLRERKVEVQADEWVLEVDYVDVAPYPPLLRVGEQQRVAVALELLDDDEGSLSPQAAVQTMPIVKTMVHLGGMKQPIWAPIKIPTG